MSEVEGATQKRLDRLWGHLIEIEEITGGVLRGKPRAYRRSCPIALFAPNKDKEGRRFGYCIFSLGYGNKGTFKRYVPTYYKADIDWWWDLPLSKQEAITKWIIQKIKERNETQKVS